MTSPSAAGYEVCRSNQARSVAQEWVLFAENVKIHHQCQFVSNGCYVISSIKYKPGSKTVCKSGNKLNSGEQRVKEGLQHLVPRGEHCTGLITSHSNNLGPANARKRTELLAMVII